jgi:hypothetical protein
MYCHLFLSYIILQSYDHKFPIASQHQNVTFTTLRSPLLHEIIATFFLIFDIMITFLFIASHINIRHHSKYYIIIQLKGTIESRGLLYYHVIFRYPAYLKIGELKTFHCNPLITLHCNIVEDYFMNKIKTRSTTKPKARDRFNKIYNDHKKYYVEIRP